MTPVVRSWGVPLPVDPAVGDPHPARPRADPDDDRAGFLAVPPARTPGRAERADLAQPRRPAGPGLRTHLSRTHRPALGLLAGGHRDGDLRHGARGGRPPPDLGRRPHRRPCPDPAGPQGRRHRPDQPRLGPGRAEPDRLPRRAARAPGRSDRRRPPQGGRDDRQQRHQGPGGTAGPAGDADQQRPAVPAADPDGPRRVHRADRPRPTGDLPEQIASPDDSSIGPHMAYAVQWWLFVAAVPVGWIILVRREKRDREQAAAESATADAPEQPEPASA